jgi:hypothetical protein
MNADQISKELLNRYGITDEEIINEEIEIEELSAHMEAILDSDRKILWMPDILHDSSRKRWRKAQSKRTLRSFARKCQKFGLTVYVYVIELENETEEDSLYSEDTLKKARRQTDELFGNIPSQLRLERQGGRNGKLHIQGMVALLEGNYPPKHFLPLEIEGGIEKSVIRYGSYLSKPNEGRVLRDMSKKGHPFCCPLEIRLLGVIEWYTMTLKNRKNGIKTNPHTAWRVNGGFTGKIPWEAFRRRHAGDYVSISTPPPPSHPPRR